jgi:hypothetical protein
VESQSRRSMSMSKLPSQVAHSNRVIYTWLIYPVGPQYLSLWRSRHHVCHVNNKINMYTGRLWTHLPGISNKGKALIKAAHIYSIRVKRHPTYRLDTPRDASHTSHNMTYQPNEVIRGIGNANDIHPSSNRIRKRRILHSLNLSLAMHKCWKNYMQVEG